MTNLIPLAGKGQRFVDAGYKTPKPLVPISGKPMIIQAAHALPPADRWIFIVRKDYVSDYNIEKLLKQEFSNATVLIDKNPVGQATSVMVAEKLIDNDEPLTIGPCDNDMVYSQEKWLKFIAQPKLDAAIFTFRNYPTLATNPTAWGWVKIKKDGTVEKVSVKIPISDDPIHDHAVVGAFYFRRGKDFVRLTKEMIRQNRRIKNEFYIDELMNVFVEDGKKVKVFEIDKYIGWGTPNDLKTYEYWENYFDKADHHPFKKK